MKKYLSFLLLGVAALLVVAVPAGAIDAPHNESNGYSCASCHTVHQYLGSAGYNNICVNCHRPGAPKSGNKPFTLADAANPFGTFTATLPGKSYQTSHNWLGGDNVPAAGAKPPLSPNLNLSPVGLPLRSQGTVACIRCHDIHAPSGASVAAKPFLRMANDRDQMCLDCHRSWNTTDHVKGTHPVNFTYTSASFDVKRRGAEYNNPPLNVNPANPTAAMNLKSGLVTCSTCHGVHYTDSSSATTDGPAGYNKLRPSDGKLLRSDVRGADGKALNLCTSCHKKTNHNARNENVQCSDCHGAHVDTGDGSKPNVFLLKRFISFSSAKGNVKNVPVFFQSTSAKNYVTADGKGLCQACHIVPTGGIFPDEHASNDSNSCNDCHIHNAPNSFMVFAGGCTICHGNPPTANTAGGPNGYAGDYSARTGVNEALAPHLRHSGGGADYSYACWDCHKGYSHKDGKFQDVFPVTTGTIAATAGAIPTYDKTARTCATVYCHSDGAPRNASLVAVPGFRSIPAWPNGKGKIADCNACHDARPSTNVHAKHLAKGYGCVVCHAGTVSNDTTISDKKKHADGIKTVVFSGMGAGTVWNASTATCSSGKCHATTAGGAAPAVWTNPATGGCGSCHGVAGAIATGAAKITSAGHGTHLAAVYGPAPYLGANVSSCQVCHSYAASGAAGHVNGTVDTVAGSCSPCHVGSIPAWTAKTRISCESCHAATPARLPNGVVAPHKGAFEAKGHGKYSGSNQCIACHDSNAAHISGTLGDNMRLLLPNDNMQCASCHSDAAKVADADRRDLGTHLGGGSLCKGCHDVHGTANAAMIREVINGVPISFNNASTAFVKTSAPFNGLCQVCHTATRHYKSGQAMDGHPTKGCLACHSHKGAVAFAPTGGGTCDSCHGYPPAPAGFTGTQGNYSSARAQDYAGGAGAHLIPMHVKKNAKPSEGWANCSICHSNGAADPATHTMATPVTPSKVTIDVADKYKFNNGIGLGPAQYTGKLLDGGANVTGGCFNVKCHFKPSKKWSTEK